MKLTSRSVQRETKIELSMTSMIDVVFLLLIFFMTTSAFVKTERHLDSAIKVKRESAESTSDLEPAIVDVMRSGDRFVFQLGARQFTDQKELSAVLARFENKLDGAFVRVDGDVPFALAAAAIQACKSAKFVSVSYVPLDQTD